jgi:ribosomal-protein-alanine N-acetyltransferase
MQSLDTERLKLDPLTADDADFIFELHSDPGFKRFIGDRGVHSPADAIPYLTKGPWDCYQRLGFGQMLVTRRDDGEKLGTCGLLQRDWLELPDIGYALLARHAAKGYGREAAQAVLDDAQQRLGIRRVGAIVSPENAASVALLTKLGFEYERPVQPPGEEREISFYLREV